MAGSALYCGGVIVVLLFLQARGWLTPATAFLALGSGGAMAGVVTLARLRPDWHDDRFSLRSLAVEHWAYGRWALATALVSWAPLNIYYLVLPTWTGLTGSAALRAVMNLALPALHTLIALSALLLPLLVQRRRAGGDALVTSAAWWFAAIFAGMTVCYLGAMWLGRGFIFDLLYRGKYREYVSGVVWAGLAPVAATGTVVLGSMLRARERPDQIFHSWAAAAVVTMTAGLALAAAWGVVGATVGIVISYVVASGLMLRYWRNVSVRMR